MKISTTYSSEITHFWEKTVKYVIYAKYQYSRENEDKVKFSRSPGKTTVYEEAKELE